MTSDTTGCRRSSSAGVTTCTPVNIRSVTAPSGARGDRASRMLTTRPVASTPIAPQRRGSGSSRSSMVADRRRSRACAASSAGRSRSATTLAFITSSGPASNSGRALARPPPVPSSSRLDRVGDVDGRGRIATAHAFTQHGLNHVAAVEHVDHRPAGAGARGRVQSEADRRVAAHRDQRLRGRQAEGAEPRRPARPQAA